MLLIGWFGGTKQQKVENQWLDWCPWLVIHPPRLDMTSPAVAPRIPLEMIAEILAEINDPTKQGETSPLKKDPLPVLLVLCGYPNELISMYPIPVFIVAHNCWHSRSHVSTLPFVKHRFLENHRPSWRRNETDHGGISDGRWLLLVGGWLT